MKIRLLILTMALFTTTSFVWALDLQTQPQELATSIVEVCNNDIDCIEFKRFILWDIFKTADNIDLKINMLMTILLINN